MKSSDFKRGLAVSAVSALAVAGVPFLATSASAAPVDVQVGDGNVVLYSQFTGDASVKNDPQDSTIRLEAGAGADIAQVTFQYRISDGAAWQDIAAVSRNDDGAFSHEWTPPAGVIGATVDIRVVGSTSATPPVEASDVADDVVINGGGAATESVNIDSGSQLGVFQQPYGGADTADNVRVSGTTSGGGPVALSWFDGATRVEGGNATLGANGAWTGVLDIEGYDYAGSPDQLVVGAANGSDDVESFTLYNQTITTVQAVAADTSRPNGTTDVTVTVLDQNGEPIVGARVAPDTAAAAEPDVQLTDADGQAVFTQDADTTTFYFADTTDAAGFQQGTDVRSEDVNVAQYEAVPTELDATLPDELGSAFDLDEAPATIPVQVRDQEGEPLDVEDVQDLHYRWVITPFDGSAPVTVPNDAPGTPAAETNEVTEETDGLFEVPFPDGDVEGTYELFASLEPLPPTPGPGQDPDPVGGIDESRILTFKAGEAEVVLTPAGAQTAEAGGEVALQGKLALDDGTALAGRDVTVTYTRGASGSDDDKDSGIVPATGSAVTLSRTFTTSAEGTFDLVVDDVEGDGTELDNQLVADSDITEATEPVEIDFASSTPPEGATVDVEVDETGKPGVASTGTVTVLQADGPDADTDPDGPVVGQRVTLTVDHGFFTTGAEQQDEDNLSGNLVDLGQTITVTTDADGTATFQVSIGRDEGFDDDGEVEAVVSADAGPASDEDTITFDSADPLNGGEVRVEQSPASVQDNPTGPTAVGGVVWYDVYTTDQFGNLVHTPEAELDFDVETADADGGAEADLSGNNDADFEADGDFAVLVTGDEAETVTTTVTWNQPVTEENAALPDPAALTDSVTEEFYLSEFGDDSQVTITSSPEGTVDVGTPVTETVTVLDAQGNPIAGLEVTFVRTGPGATTDRVERTTNANGEASYAFVGTEAGTAQISVEITDGSHVETVTDEVVFLGPVDDEPTAELKGRNNGKKADRLRVVTTDPAADGAEVTLYRVKKGDRVEVATKTLNDNGRTKFRVKDGKKGKRTFIAVVAATDDTVEVKTNRKRVR